MLYKSFALVCLLVFLGFSCDTNNSPKNRASILTVDISDNPVTSHYSSILRINVEDTSIVEPYSFWEVQFENELVSDSLVKGLTYYWVAPPQPGLYTISVQVSDEKERKISEPYTFDVSVKPWETPIIDPGQPGKIVFGARDSLNLLQIFTINDDGTNLIQLTHFGGDAENEPEGFDPNWSPDGERIAFSRFSNSPTYPSSWIMNSDGSEVKAIKNSRGYPLPGQFPELLNDKLAYTCPGCPGSAFFELYVFDLDKGTNVELTNDHYYDNFPKWHPDGNRLYFLSNRGNDPGERSTHLRLFIINEDKTGLKKVFDEGNIYTSIWENSGYRIAYRKDKTVYILNLNSGVITEVYTSEHAPNLYGWSADGERLLIYEKQIGYPYLNKFQILDIESGNIDLLYSVYKTNNTPHIFGIDWFQFNSDQ